MKFLGPLFVIFCMHEWYFRGRLSLFLFREFTRVIVLIDIACLKIVQTIKPPPYVLQGQCDKRGSCCKQIVSDPPKRIKTSPRAERMYLAFHALFHHFTLVARGESGEYIFKCGHLKTDGRCGIYRYRPFICRNYPVRHFFRPPALLAGCGYKIVPRALAKTRYAHRLPILNPIPAVHHPTPDKTGRASFEERLDDYHRVDID